MFQQIMACIAFAAVLAPVGSLNDRLHAILADVANQPRTPSTAKVPTVLAGISKTGDALTVTAYCPTRHVVPSRLLRYGAQLANALIVGNAVKRGSYGHVFGSASPLRYAAEYAALDLVVDHLDRRASCDVQAKINAFFTFSALYNAGQTEFAK